jgi:hypothetical protein
MVTSFAVSGGGTDQDQLRGVDVDGAGAVVAVGFFKSTTPTFGGVELTNAGSADAVVWKMSADGTTLWAVRGGGSNGEYTYAIAVDASNAVVVSGHFKNSASTFGDVELTPVDDYDVVVWKMSADGTTLWAVGGGGTGMDRSYGVAVVGRCSLTLSNPR